MVDRQWAGVIEDLAASISASQCQHRQLPQLPLVFIARLTGTRSKLYSENEANSSCWSGQ
ncbi:MAG: hypothetical protein CL912_33535 [Deltaproteobacteria bacterium]|nr:hypothetical protein [Deltaproteobacteria bacterium]